jgi:hypothetical protein
MRRHLLAIAGILTVAAGCDNVAWGGARIELRAPRPASADSASTSALGPANVADRREQAAVRPFGVFLLAGVRDGARGNFVAVAEIEGDTLRALDVQGRGAERVRRAVAAGSTWTLFAEGVRVGTFVADSMGQAGEYCPERPALSGTVELVPTASEAQRFLALPTHVGGSRRYGPFRALDDSYEQRVATLAWAGEAIPRFQAEWPPAGLVAARQSIRAFQTPGAPGPLVAATFVHRDQLAVGPASPGAYALFLLGSRVEGTYREDFAWYRAVDAEGKGAPRYFDHLDWDGDGSADILLDVFGSSRRWFAALAQRDGRWVRTYQDACGAAGSAGG